jgi:torulene dioxygenase
MKYYKLLIIALPNGKEEDEGVVVAVVIDHLNNDSFLLLLNGWSFTEIGRARTPHLIPAGLHGQYFH